ncbi:MAG: Asp23/Gls24 family envelope stress response protein [Clostridia bacterium]|nr:MAG: Asp23/Gls24 family envelope stress response protein [Clostridia bacterium]
MAVEVLALIGPSGTGKSHRALSLAHEFAADMIIDDGLVIYNGSVIAGKSAKQEPSRLAAIRAAVFTDHEMALEAKERIAATRPDRILVLGTSLRMVEYVTRQLELPVPARIITIDEVASPHSIALAKRTRQNQGKHVIPAPTVELKPRFSGTLVEPLTTIIRRRHPPHDGGSHTLWLEQSVVRPTFSFLGRFYISTQAMADIIRCSTRGLAGLENIRYVQVENQDGGVTVGLEVSVVYGFSIPQVAVQVQRQVTEAVENMTALNVLRVDVNVKKLARVVEEIQGREVDTGKN